MFSNRVHLRGFVEQDHNMIIVKANMTTTATAMPLKTTGLTMVFASFVTLTVNFTIWLLGILEHQISQLP